MAQTPKSVSAYVGSTTPVTLYTVPTGATAVVKSVLTSSLIGGYPSMTINKVSGGITYPLAVNAVSGYAANSGTGYAYPANETLNLLNGPITLAAGDVLSVSTSTTGSYKFPTNYSPTTNPGQRIFNMNYLNGNYIAIGAETSTGYGLVLTSSDGITWTKQTFNFAIGLTDIGFDGTYYVMCGVSNLGYAYYSTNLTSWTQVATGTNENMYCITYGNSKWLMGGSSGIFAYATTPTSWTTATLPGASNINAVLVIGTNFCFGTDGAYIYTTDFSTYTKPYYPVYGQTTNANQMAVDSAGKIYTANTNIPNNFPATCLYQSTDNGKTFTAIDLTSVSGTKPTAYGSVYCFGNGGKIYWMFNHPANSRYLSSSDGVTWLAQQYTGTYSTDNSNWYSTNLYTSLGTTTATSVLFNWIYSPAKVLLNPVDSTGVVGGSTVSFISNASYIDPNGYGYLIPIGNVQTGTWSAWGVNAANAAYANYWYGSSSSVGSNSTYVDNAWYTAAYGQPIAGCGRPATSGYIFGTTSGYIAYTSGTTGGGNMVGRISGISAAIVAIVASGNLSTSKIVLLYDDGRNAYSTDQGLTWTLGQKISDTFTYNSFTTNMSLVYGGGLFVAWANNTNSYYYSTDGINWIGNPTNIQNMYTLNSKNIFLQTAGLVYTNGTSPDAFASGGTVTPNAFPSVRRMAYVGGSYFMGVQNQISQSTDLINWTTNSFSGTQINNQLYYTSYGSSTVSIAYSGSGSSFAVGNALRNQSTSNVSLGQPTSLANALVVGSTTVGLVEIT